MFLYLLLPVVGFCVWFVLQRYQKLQTFQRLGIPTPADYSFWFGHLGKFADDNTRHLVIRDFTAEYGNMWGLYHSAFPILIIADPELVKDVLVRKFDSFHARRLFPSERQEDHPKADIFSSMGDRWKRQRQVINPSFSTGRFKSNFQLMLNSLDKTDSVCDIMLRESNDDSFNIHEAYLTFTTQIICSFAFGIDLVVEGEDIRDNVLLKKLQKFFTFFKELPLWLGFVMIVPELGNFFVNGFGKWFNSFEKVTAEVEAIVDRCVTTRLSDPSTRRPDLLQGMIDHMVEEGEEEKRGGVYITRKELCSTSFLMMAAGQETTNSTLTFLTYELARNPEHQDRCRAEILEYCGPQDFDYDQLMKLTYLEWCVLETLRKYPIGDSAPSRRATDDVVLGGYEIPKGLCVQVDVRSLHYNLDYFGPEDPEEFVPERFHPDRVAARPSHAFLAFGGGPRICPGMRLADLEIRIMMTHMLRKYRIRLAPSQAVPIKVLQGETLSPREGLKVILETL